ncbi:MAG: DUF2163 domain-containing protein [Pelagimonas sp.]|jgi:uncharacterized phage protein (TIGR02218 family)|nr:DUF2163 domain-containing protein [Pelagimonas sp.]
MSGKESLHAHLATGLATVARCWAVKRRDGLVLGFTDHDRELAFEGITFRADTGMSARALQQATGLSVDNSEAMGALSDAAIHEEDIAAGRYDGAEVTSWLVNWADLEARKVVFHGHIGELRRGNGAFHAELRGLTDKLNQPLGRVYQKPSTVSHVGGGSGFDMMTPGYFFEGTLSAVEGTGRFIFDDLSAYQPDWFLHGRLDFLDGDAIGISGTIKRDLILPDGRRAIDLWEPVRARPVAGDQVRLLAGDDKSFETSRLKFNNAVNFQGFPDIPDEDWVMVNPGRSGTVDGGSRR